MSLNKLFIPTLCKVGFNDRSDTYSGKLGYVIAKDGSKWRKEESWKNWILNILDSEDAKKQSFDNYTSSLKGYEESLKRYEDRGDKYYISYYKDLIDRCNAQYKADPFSFLKGRITANAKFTPFEFDNVPTSGFVLNKKAGGTRYSWNNRATYARVYDPRGFEIEISVDNLLFILQECDCSKGKGLEGEFVYSWSGKDLVLLPVNSQDYVESAAFTKTITSKGVSAKDLKVGTIYMLKSGEKVVYLGKHLKKGKLKTEHFFHKENDFSKIDNPKNLSYGWYLASSTVYSHEDETLDKASVDKITNAYYKQAVFTESSAVNFHELKSNSDYFNYLYNTAGYSRSETGRTVKIVDKISDNEYHVYKTIVSSEFSNNAYQTKNYPNRYKVSDYIDTLEKVATVKVSADGVKETKVKLFVEECKLSDLKNPGILYYI